MPCSPGFCATTASTKCGASRGGSLRTIFGGSTSSDCWSRVIIPKSASRASDRVYLRVASSGWRQGLKRVGACGRPARKIASLKVRSRAGFAKYARAGASGPSRRFRSCCDSSSNWFCMFRTLLAPVRIAAKHSQVGRGYEFYPEKYNINPLALSAKIRAEIEANICRMPSLLLTT